MIDLGAVYQVAVDVADASGIATDPDEATLTITLPDGTTVTPAVPLPSTSAGQLRVDYATVQAGRHVWRLVTSGPTTAYADTFDVQDQAQGIVSLARVKSHLGIPVTDTSDDEDLRGWIGGATRAIERHLGTAVVRRTVTERQRPDRYGQLLLRQLPVIGLVSVATPDGAQTWDIGDLDVDPDTGLVTVTGGAGLGQPVDVVYQVGLTVVGDDCQQAALIIVQHLWETKRGVMGVQLGGEGESWTPGRGFAIPRRALELLDSPLPGVA